jgi:hypothetical protein
LASFSKLLSVGGLDFLKSCTASSRSSLSVLISSFDSVPVAEIILFNSSSS